MKITYTAKSLEELAQFLEQKAVEAAKRNQTMTSSADDSVYGEGEKDGWNRAAQIVRATRIVTDGGEK